MESSFEQCKRIYQLVIRVEGGNSSFLSLRRARKEFKDALVKTLLEAEDIYLKIRKATDDPSLTGTVAVPLNVILLSTTEGGSGDKIAWDNLVRL
jgi:hypothetical protein